MEEKGKYEVTGKEENGLGLITKQAQVSMFLNEQRFEFAQRIGKMIAASTMVPEHFRNNLGNCLIALNLSERLGVDVFGLMQTSYVVHGRPGFEAKLLIAIFNARTHLFIPPLRWEFKGDFPKGQDAGCRAYAVDKETKEPLYGEWIDWDLVKAEGWEKKTGSKWLTMPGQMYRYRSASFFINAYEPGLKMGIQTVDELEDIIIDVTPRMKIEGNGKEPVGDIYEVKETQHGKVTDLDETPLDNSSLTKTDAEKLAEGQAKLDEKRKTESEIIDEKTSFRERWVNLKSAGYSTYIHKNFRIIEEACKRWPDLHQEMIEKWVRLYPTTEWPLSNVQNPPQVKISQKDEGQRSIGDESKVHPDQASAISAGILKRKEEEKVQGNGYVRCPFNQNKAKAVKICQTCTEKEKCQPYQEYFYNNPPE